MKGSCRVYPGKESHFCKCLLLFFPQSALLGVFPWVCAALRVFSAAQPLEELRGPDPCNRAEVGHGERLCSGEAWDQKPCAL